MLYLSNWMIMLIIFIAALLPRLFTARKLDMTWDETYTFNGAIFLRNILRRDFSYEAWSFSFNPPFLMYLYGLSYAIYVFIKNLRLGLKRDYDQLYKQALSLASGKSFLLATRMPSIIMGSLSCVIVYLLSMDMFNNQIIGIIAALSLALTPHYIAQTSVAALDGGVSFFYLLTVWSFYRAIILASLGYLILSGILLGLTVSSKLTGATVTLAIIPWVIFEISGNTNRTSAQLWYPFYWISIGIVVFCATWPLLWGNSIKRFPTNVRALVTKSYDIWPGDRSFYRGTTKLQPDFYVTHLLVTTPIYLLLLSGLGMIDAIQSVVTRSNALLLAFWVILPVVALSLPIYPYRDGVRIVSFVFPSLAIFAGLGLQGIIHYGTFLPQKEAIDLISIILIMGLLTFECAKIHPYYLDYYNQMVGGLKGAQNSFFVGWWGEGMAEAIAYVDQHAPSNSTIWIYGPKGSAFYHSTRVDLNKSTCGEPFFMGSTKGIEYSIDEKSYYELRRGDLVFSFPYYHPKEDIDFDVFQEMKRNNVAYVVVYRRQTYPTQVDLGNQKIIETLRNRCKPVYTVKIKEVEVCWVYHVKSCEMTSYCHKHERFQTDGFTRAKNKE